MQKQGVKLEDANLTVDAGENVKLLALDADESTKQYFVVFNNFISITRYNTSPLYAMAVYDLSRAIKEHLSDASVHVSIMVGFRSPLLKQWL